MRLLITTCLNHDTITPQFLKKSDGIRQAQREGEGKGRVETDRQKEGVGSGEGALGKTLARVG